MFRAARYVLPIVLLVTVFVFAQTSNSSAPPVPSSGNAQQARPFDINAAANAYLAKMPPAQRARSEAYFEGGYWLMLWDFLSTVLVMWLMLHLRCCLLYTSPSPRD